MKISLIRSFVSTVAAITCVTGFLLAPAQVSAQLSTVVADQAYFMVNVAVPDDGEAVTYMSGRELFTIKPSENSNLPANARDIKLTRGAIFTVIALADKYSSKGGIPVASAKGGIPAPSGVDGSPSNAYTVNEPVTLSSLSPAVLKANSNSFTLTGQTGTIKLPSGSMIDLINEIRIVTQSAQGTQTPNPPVSDAND